ncbi:hypothetical protein Gohar_025183, partial [Gossypium harknessii]|nr:hypothetical protein [Gossypium harknessii]
ESEIHAIKDCSFSQAVWNSIVPPQEQVLFFSLPLDEWIMWNLQNIGDCGSHEVDCQTLFPIVCRLLWKNKNMFVFPTSHSSIQDVVDTSISWTRSYFPPSMPSFHAEPMVTIMKWSAPERSIQKV